MIVHISLYSRNMKILFITSFFLLGCALRASEARCYRTFVAPKALRVNTPENVYVDFHDCENIVQLSASLMSLPSSEEKHCSYEITTEHMNEPLKVEVKVDSNKIETEMVNRKIVPTKKALLILQYCFSPPCDPSEIVSDSIKMDVNYTHGYAFMTTNRPAYRPNEEVQIVVAVTDQSLLVPSDMVDKKIPFSIKIKTPKEYDNIVVHDQEVSVGRDGFLDHTYRIPEDTIKGIWLAEAIVNDEVMASTSFVIDKYVTPTFDVKIVLDQHYILPTQESITGKILALYSYGEPVDGYYYLSLKLVRADGSEREFHRVPGSFTQTASIRNGEKRFSVRTQQIRAIADIEELLEEGAKVIVLASVTGISESVFESDVVDDVIFTRSPYSIDYSRSSRFYLPRTIYKIMAVVRDAVNGAPVEGVPVRIQTTDGQELLLSNENGEIYHEVDSLSRDEEDIVLTTEDVQLGPEDQYTTSYTVSVYQSINQLALRLNKQIASVGERVNLQMDIGQSTPTDIRIYVISRGQVVSVKTKHLNAGQNGEVTIPLTITPEMVPNFRIVAYYVTDGAATANSVWFDVVNQCTKEITVSTDRDDVLPGGAVTITATGPPNGHLYITAVDRAAYFVHNDSRLTRDTLWGKMESYDTGCSRQGGRNAASVFQEAGMMVHSELDIGELTNNWQCESAADTRKRRSATQQVVVDEDEAFLWKCDSDGQRENTFGLNCSQRAKSIRRNVGIKEHLRERCASRFVTTCQEFAGTSASVNVARSAQADVNVQERRDRVRSDFAENWFFSKRPVGSDGQTSFDRIARHSITIFDLEAFGMSALTPFCVSKPKEVRVFQDTFIQLYLPYSVRVGEQATIRFSVFNYGDEDRDVEIKIRHSKEICSNFNSEDFRLLTNLVVEPRSAQSSYFTILPLKIPDGGKATIEIQGGEHDWVSKKLLIEPPGQHNESFATFMLTPEEDRPVSFDFNFDIANTSVLLKTRKCQIFLYGHAMGPNVEVDPFESKLSNLNQYIRVPAGCGEQNMIRIGPAVYVHKYRQAAFGNDVTIEQTNQIVQYIQKAYAIELNWRSDQVRKRAFAVWNTSPPSTWLNAFVTKVFSAAKEYWPGMDANPICNAVEWLLGTQNQDGSFPENHHVHHGEMRGSVEDAITLTAYVSVSLREVAPTCERLIDGIDPSMQRAINYLDRKLGPATTPYTLAMGAYALAVAGHPSAENWNAALMRAKQHEGEYVLWRGPRGRASNIETTAYALLAEVTLHGITEFNEEMTRKIAHWLITNRNDLGGFVSTQDTVLALQALSKYMTVLESTEFGPQPTNIILVLSSNSFDSPWHDEPVNTPLTHENKDKRITVNVPETAIDQVTATVTGVGAGSMAYRCTWRQFAEAGQCHFTVDVSVHEDDGDTKILKVSVQKSSGDPAQMSIIDVQLLSGFEAVEESVKRLTKAEAVDAQTDRYELTENTVKFYLSDIDENPRKLAFKIREVARVNNRQPASVTVYDYYEPEIRCTKFYSTEATHRIRTICEGGEGEGKKEICRCSEGACMKCRTRAQQLNDTVCSSHSQHTKACTRTCKKERKLSCYNLHRETCNRDYVYIVRVLEVRNFDIPGIKHFTAFVEEAFRLTASHRNPVNSTVDFLLREDCFHACHDDRFEELAEKRFQKTGIRHEAQNYIFAGRHLLVYGKAPSSDSSQNPKRYTYDLDENAGVEIFPESTKCDAKEENAEEQTKAQRKKRKILKKLCEMKSILKDAHNKGCD